MTYHLSAIVSKGELCYVARGVEVELASQGKTVEEALQNLKEAFGLWIKHAEPDELELLTKIESPIVAQVAVAA